MPVLAAQPQVAAPAATRTGFPRSLWLFLAILAGENSLAVAIPHPWFVIYLYRGSPILFGLALVFFGRPQFKTAFRAVTAPRRTPLILHIATLLALALLEWVLTTHQGDAVLSFWYAPAVFSWVLCLAVLVGTCILTFFSLRQAAALARSLRSAWIYALAITTVVVLLRERLRLAWATSSSQFGSFALSAAFSQTRWVLQHFYPVVVQDPATHILGTDRFLVLVGGTCSGVEGLALMSAFSVAWLVFARRELRVWRAVLLIPVALVLMWILNVLRLVALIAIGDAGYPRMASQGFHSEAGWIAFNLVSLAFLVVAQNLTWLRKSVPVAGVSAPEALPRTDSKSRHSNLAAIYLGPFLAITAAAVISQATSAGFEWLYPLRLLAALAVLWWYRDAYRKMDWRFGTLGVAVGVGVALVWLGVHVGLVHWHLAEPDTETAAGLLTLSPLMRVGWILLRVLGAVTTVPLAEELAFRGFLARRLSSEAVDQIAYSRLGLLGIAVSSLAFGLVHGRMWLPGVLAGLAFALVARARGRLGEAFAAHAAANLCIAVVAVATHDYSLW